MNIKDDKGAMPTNADKSEPSGIPVLDESIRERALRAMHARGKLGVTLMSVATVTLVIAGLVYKQQID